MGRRMQPGMAQKFDLNAMQHGVAFFLNLKDRANRRIPLRLGPSSLQGYNRNELPHVPFILTLQAGSINKWPAFL